MQCSAFAGLRLAELRLSTTCISTRRAEHATPRYSGRGSLIKGQGKRAQAAAVEASVQQKAGLQGEACSKGQVTGSKSQVVCSISRVFPASSGGAFRPR